MVNSIAEVGFAAQRKCSNRQAARQYIDEKHGQTQQSHTMISSRKKSIARPRPAVIVPPRGIGPIKEPNDNDVLCGRGGCNSTHMGNGHFRELVCAHRHEYAGETKLERAHIAAAVVQDIRGKQPPGRFLKEDPDGMWYDIGDTKAIKKAGQALREDADGTVPDLGTETPDTPVGAAPAANATLHAAVQCFPQQTARKPDEHQVDSLFGQTFYMTNTSEPSEILGLSSSTIAAMPWGVSAEKMQERDAPRHHESPPQNPILAGDASVNSMSIGSGGFASLESLKSNMSAVPQNLQALDLVGCSL